MVEEVKGVCLKATDMIFIVAEEDKEKAIEVLEKAIKDFPIRGFMFYSIFLQKELAAAGIAFEAYEDTEES